MRLNFEVRLYSETATEAHWLAVAKRLAKAARGRRKECEVIVFAGDESVTLKHDGSFNHHNRRIKNISP